MFAQVKLSLRTVSVAVRVPGRESSRRHGHIADSVAAVGFICWRFRRSTAIWRCRKERTVKPSPRHGRFDSCGWHQSAYGLADRAPPSEGGDRGFESPWARDARLAGGGRRPAKPSVAGFDPRVRLRAGFLAGQRATAPERQREVKLPDLWLSQIEGFLESVPIAPGQERVLVHTEVIREHLMVNAGTWTLSGLLDFERTMTGDRACEFVTVGLFVSRGDPRLLGRILAAYGRSFDPRELLAYTLLHRHSNLPECLRELRAPPEPTLESLALTWFGTA